MARMLMRLKHGVDFEWTSPSMTRFKIFSSFEVKTHQNGFKVTTSIENMAKYHYHHITKYISFPRFLEYKKVFTSSKFNLYQNKQREDV